MEKYIILIAFTIRYDVTHSPGYDEIQRLCQLVSRNRETFSQVKKEETRETENPFYTVLIY
jgi:hypothetical protein